MNDRARRLLLPGLVASPNAEVVAVCSRDPDKGSAAARAAGDGVRAFRSLEALLAARLADAVYLNTPLETHVPLALAAMRAGCAVICEKPLAPSVAEAERLAREADRTGVRTAVNFTYRSVPGYRLTQRLLTDHPHSDRPLGRPLHARFELLQGHNFLSGFPRASALLDSGSHLFDLMASLLEAAWFGSIREVVGAPLDRGEAPDYGWSFTARTSTGLAVSGLFTRSALGWRNGLRWTLSGHAGALEVELDADRTRARAAWRRPGAGQGHGQGHGQGQGVWKRLRVPRDIAADDARFPAYHLDRLVRAIRGEERFPAFADAVLPNRIAEALSRSAETGSWAAV